MDATHTLRAAFFFIIAILLVVRRRQLLDFPRAYRAWGIPREQRRRIAAAFAARGKRDTFHTAWAGTVAGIASLGAASLVLFSDIPFDTVLGAELLVLATLLSLCVAMRRRPRLEAVVARAPARRLPWYLWSVVGMLAIGPLLWFALAPIGATLFSSAGLAIVSLAYRLANGAPVGAGDDLAAAAFVDARIRTTRVGVLWALAILPGYVFELTTPGDVNLAMHAILFVAPLGIALGNLHIGRAARLMPAA